MEYKAINPSTGEELHTVACINSRELEIALEESFQAYLKWRETGFEYRAGLVRSAADILREQKEKFAGIITREMGKPITSARGEIEKCARLCDYYAEHAAGLLSHQEIEVDSGRSFVAYNPLGPVLAVMPWNFPFWQVLRFAVPALMAGNTCLLKHAANVPGCAAEVEKVLLQAGLPGGVFCTLFINKEQALEILGDRRIRGATLTGSVSAGRAIAERAGSMLKKTVLELGGSDPYLVLEDADLELAARTCAASRLMNNGQTCIAAKRIIVVQKVYDGFMDLFLQEMARGNMADPMLDDCTLGPLAREDLRRELHSQVERSIRQGAELKLGGYIPEGPGFWYPATVLAGVKPGMPAFEEELFGPAAAVISANDEKDAIELANRSRFGLGSAVFTRDIKRGARIASREIEAGSCFVNAMVQSDPRLPFGGIKDSGYGRELSVEGIREFTNIKTVFVK
ncbi:NAD-dependent succinate-semialdehyde dehydrogenase [Desulfonatronospira sp.]|uniref:NAD-dependent succinate-semialdehyde dehydrogenase n=1 Tax=Desulfonatronospira sp. TaxID=1962951 RepID=UPI0025BDF8CD|nr:NAD-dependent succinate-semialdehyde dehydrogenase [Desulfonatronospira sp.]